MYRNIAVFISVVALSLTFFAYPQTTLAQTPPSATTRAALLAQIEALLQQIQVLQALVNERLSEEIQIKEITTKPQLNAQNEDDEFEIFETFYFGTDFEAIYEVDSDLKLIRRDLRTGVRVSDLRLWDLFVDTIGKKETKRYIDEFRVFDQSTSHIGAFVELRRSTAAPDYWILGINEDDFDSRSDPSRRSYSALFIHEFAHLIIEDEEEIMADFTDSFWSQKDLRHARATEELSGQELDDALEEYYEDNENDFVSDYATYNPDEDFAETFTYFVINNRPRNTNDLWSDKVDFMYEFDRLTDLRLEIRDNLDL